MRLFCEHLGANGVGVLSRAEADSLTSRLCVLDKIFGSLTSTRTAIALLSIGCMDFILKLPLVLL